MKVWTYTLDPSDPDEDMDEFYWEPRDIYQWLVNREKTTKWAYRHTLTVL